MNSCIFRWLFLVAILGLSRPLNAQLTVYPGDANNNGIVNNIDVLYIGYSFGTPGPSRVLTDTEFEPQQAPAAWATAFPDGLSFAYADANGDGIIGSLDLLAVYYNYGATHPPVTPDEFPVAPEGASRLHMEKENEPVPLIPGSVFSIPLYLNEADLPIELNGLAFSLEYDDEVIREIRFEWAPSWFNADSSWYGLQAPVMADKAQLDVVATRFGNDPVTGAGLLGKVNIIIEDDLIGLLPAPTDSVNVLVGIKKLRAIGKDFIPVPLRGDDYTFTIYHPNARPNKTGEPAGLRFSMFPNPAQDYLSIEAEQVIRSVIIQDLLGRTISMIQDPGVHSVQLPLPDLPPGIYLIRVRTAAGVGCRELLINGRR